jgi:hypothetical protein
MGKNILSATILIIFIVLIRADTLFAQVSVGVKESDWIEYQVTISGTAPQDHNITWARMEVTTLQGNNINLAIATEFSNGTMLNETITLNLEVGELGDDFIIPANLNTGDAFFDKHQGEITITKTEEKIYSGALRTVVTAATPQTTYYWDNSTGILLEAISTFNDYSMHTIMNKTNLWQSEIFDSYPIIFYVFIVIAVIGLAILTVVISRRRRK